MERAQTFFQRAAATAHEEKRPVAERIAAARLLGYGPFHPQTPFAAGGPISDRGQLPFFATFTDGRGVFLLATPAG